ncbi:MAG: DUF99 family protein [Sulfolobales archaeon]
MREVNWIIGIDDGYFPHSYKGMKGVAPIVAVLGYKALIRDLELATVVVDSGGLEVVITRMIRSLISRSRDINIPLVVTDSVIFAGFSIYDPRRVYDEAHIPIAPIFSHSIDLERIYLALKKHFKDYEERYAVIDKIYRNSTVIKTPRGWLRIYCLGIEQKKCSDIIIENQTTHKYPQPLRTADLVASAIGKYLSASSQESVEE